ncbi:Protein kinase domain-containing protein [Psidium guajava]|nr:Protein kinase domain-containing protein [Psidium guajava]
MVGNSEVHTAAKCATDSNNYEYQLLPSAASVVAAVPKAGSNPRDVESTEEKQVGRSIMLLWVQEFKCRKKEELFSE